MFEGLVRQLILGYLGQYIKDIHKEQLKITLWNEEVLLENVELMLEAFDYLQLPFALKQGRVGRLSIRIPWKKLGWDPIIIILEDVLVSACQRDDKEWGMDAVERREFAGKKAKLAAAELAKLSRRVCGNQTGKSFISYITAKILDGIQVSIRNVHIIYHNMLSDSVHSVFGLKFTSLTVMKQNLVGFSTAKVRGGQVNKLVEVQGLEIYCSTFQGTLDLMSIDNFSGSENFQGNNKDIYMLAPVDVSVSLLVNRSGKLENDAPQYSVNVELTGLVMSLDEARFRQILVLCDYLSTCRLREKYGRYRPWWSPLPKKLKGWQTVWWQYAQQSVLSDVRKRLRKTSWKFLGERLNCRRRYVTLYKTKLECLQQEQLVDEDTLQKLEQMEKESDIDDILSYRSAAERELQEFLVNSSPAGSGVNGANIAVDKLPRGWLNWLSRGMLGAGGTDDSSQFSGVVSDEVIKDIYEATMFHPVPSANGDSTSNGEIYLSSIKFNIQQISATLRSMKFGRAIGELIFEGIFFECKIWEESAVVNASVDSVQMLNPLNKQVTLLTRRDIFENNVPEIKDPSLCIQVDVSSINHEVSLKVILKPLEVTCHSDFLVNIMEFYNVLKSFEFQHARVLKSLNGIDNAKARFLSKAEYLLSNRKRVSWDVNIFNIIMVIPWENGNSELHKMVLELGAISFVSQRERESLASDMDYQSYIPKNFLDPISAGDSSVGFQVQDLYDLYEVKVNGFEVKISVPYDPHSTVSILEKFSATVTLASCIVLDESILRAMEVHIIIPSLRTHFSPSIYGAILGLNGNFSTFLLDSTVNPLSTSGNGPTASMGFSFSVIANLESASFLIDLENNVENSITVMLSLQGLDIRFCQVGFSECLIFAKALRIITCSEKSEDNHILCSSKNALATHSEGMDVGTSNQSDNCADKSTSADVCFFLHYKAHRKLDLISHTCTLSLNDVDLHCYPCIIGLLIGFSDKISGLNDTSHAVKVGSLTEPKNHPSMPHFRFQNFGFSNFIESGSYESESIPVDHFPFVTIYNTGALTNVDSSFIYGGPEWRKVLNLRNRKIGRAKVSTKPEFEKLYAPSPDSKFGTDPLPSSLRETGVFVGNVNISSLSVYFHDSSCIIGTITLPTSMCSLSIQKDCMDILCSTEGLILSSSWWTQTLENFLWGPSSTNLSPILNVRVTKGDPGSPKKSLLELNFSIQHVSCTLPPEFLAIIIGYFSLPDWNSSTKDQHVINNSGHMDTASDIGILYKFEMLDSALFIPVESIDSQFLKLEIPQLYCSFVLNGDPYIVLQDIPSDCLVPAHRLSDRNHCLNIFGHDLSLSLMLLKNQTLDSLKFNQDTGRRNIPLIAPIYADLWIRIPNEKESSCVNTFAPTCIMARVSNGEVIAEGEHVLVGCEALLNVVDRFASVDTESQRYTADVPQFLELKKSMKDNNALPPDSPIVTFTEIRCSVNSMSIKLYCSERESFASKIVAKAELHFLCSASLHNDKPLCLDFSFSSMAIYSFLNSVMLAECTSTCSTSSVLDINFSVLGSGENEFCVSISSLNIWLHLLDWSEVIDIINSLAAKQYNNSVLNTSTSSGLVDKFGSGTVDVSEYAGNKKDDAVSLIVKLETIGITIHIPVRLTGEALQESEDHNVEMNSSSNMVEGNQFGCVSVTLLSRNSELVSRGKTARLKLNFEKASATVELCKDRGLPSWPFFQLFQVTMEAEICYDQMEDVTVEVKCDSFDVWLSHHIFYFWHCVLFEFPEPGSSQFTFGTIDFKIQLRKLSLLLTDGKRSSNGPLLEILTRNLLLNGKVSENEMAGSVAGDLQVNYNNIHKVLWEPFVEPWKFHLSITRRQEKSALLNSEIMTDINLSSTTQLNLNLTESFIEVAFRAVDMISWGLMGLNILSESPRFSKTQISENLYTGRYAPYILQNLTSLPLTFHVCEGRITDSDLGVSALNDETLVEPGSSIPIYIDETPEEQLFRYRPSHSSDRLSDKQFMEAAHRYIIIQLEGTSKPSAPISMDLVGLNYFEVDFSLTSNNLAVDNSGDTLKGNKNIKGNPRTDVNSGYVVPVVIDVSVQKYTKLVRLYSTVILFNATSMPFEVRFDIPFGLAPKILDPIYPGQEFPLPLHLAESGRMRWRPLGNTYLWSEAYNVSNILSHENRIGFVRSFVCYPSHPSSDPFRCSLSVHEMCLPSIGKLKKGSSLNIDDSINLGKNQKRSVHLVTLCSPLLVKNFLPVALSLTIECGGVTRTALLSEVETSFFHIDSSHDLAVTINMDGFRPSILKFPRAETFVEMAKFSGTKFSLSETITFDSDSSGGPLYVTIEKVMDAFSGAREICIFVPYLLYNCTGFSLIVSSFDNETKEQGCIVPSCYDLDEQDLLQGSRRKDGLSVLSSSSHRPEPDDGSIMNSSSMKNHIISTRDNIDSHLHMFLSKPLNMSGFSSTSQIHKEKSDKHDSDAPKSLLYYSQKNSPPSSSSKINVKSPDFEAIDSKKVSACMFSPFPNSSASEIMVRVSRCLPESCLWSTPFFLVPPTGSNSVLVPQPSNNAAAAYILSVTSNTVAGPFSGKTRIITFHPRYVISNACSKDLCYKQKGTDAFFHLRIGQHSHIQWTDATRELLVSIRFDEPGSQWSGCFLPEHLGDTQLKMRNYVFGALNMIRVEVQNADVSIRGERLGGSSHGNSGTNLILLSDDDTGFMPYRIDNFSKERLRIYQQRCETFDTVIHSYTSCPYAWDEPCYPHRLTVEVPGERVIGSYTLDDVKEYAPVYLPATSEKPERTLLVSVHAEGALKVLSVIDSSYHILNEKRGQRFPLSKEKRQHDEKKETSVFYNETILIDIPFIGISVMNSYPQELIFACAKNTKIGLVRSLDHQKLSLQISSLQIDNQLHSTPYPVILSFDREHRINSVGRTKDDNSTKMTTESSWEPVFSLAASKWINKDVTLVSFEYIILRVADFHLDLEQEIILSLSDFIKTVSSGFQGSVFPQTDSTLQPLFSDFGFVKVSSKSQAHDFVKKNGGQIYSVNVPMFIENHKSNQLLPSIVPIGAPWQKNYLLARKNKKIYVELFDLAPVKLTLSFSSSPWMLRNGVLTSGESLIHRGLMALADVEGAKIHLKQLVITHQLASWESLQDILIRHYSRQLLHEIYKVFGSAGVIGNPMGFARSVGLGIKDFLSVPARSVMKSPAGLITGMAQGTTSLVSNTVYAISDAATQFSRAAQKGIVALTFDDQAAANMEKQQKGVSSHSKGVINEFLEGLTGLLQSPIKGAEKHGLPGVLSGVALGVTGLVARPAASILEVTGKTAQSIRNRSKLHQIGSHRFRVRLPRPLSSEFPLRPYSWEEAVGTSVLLAEADEDASNKLKGEILVICKSLKQGGKFVIITERLVLIVSCPSLVDLGTPIFRGVPADPEWVIETEIRMDSVIHADCDGEVVHIVGSSADTLSRQSHQQNQKRGGGGGGGGRGKRWSNSPATPLPLFQTNLEFKCKDEADNFLQVLLSTIKKGKDRGWGSLHLLHQINLK